MFHCSMCSSDGPPSPNDRSAALHRQPGTLCLLLSLAVTVFLYLNLDLKLTYLILHTVNWPALPAPLKLRHYGAIQCIIIIIIIIILLLLLLLLKPLSKIKNPDHHQNLATFFLSHFFIKIRFQFFELSFTLAHIKVPQIFSLKMCNGKKVHNERHLSRRSLLAKKPEFCQFLPFENEALSAVYNCNCR